MTFARWEDVPRTAFCFACLDEKPTAQMLLSRIRKTGQFYLRPRCKDCHNTRERGHRTSYKTSYSRAWRAVHPEAKPAFTAADRKRLAGQAFERFHRDHGAKLIQLRLRWRGIHISIVDARELLRRFGRCYPMRSGLTPEGQKEARRIAERLQARGQRADRFEINVLVYEDGLFIPPSQQSVPNKKRAQNFRRWWAQRRKQAA